MPDSGSHRPRKRFGQNFLNDPNIIAKIADAINAQKAQHLVEIGPGQGALTKSLLQSGCRLDVVELDRDLVPGLQALAEENPQLHVHNADALKLDFDTLATEEHSSPMRVVGNLPYNISTPLLFHLFGYKGLIVDCHFMLQKEVVQRMACAPGSKQYGRLSVMTQYHCRVEPLFNVPPGAFFPAPKVMSSVVRLIPHQDPIVAVPTEDALAQVVSAAFSMRRKTLLNALKTVLSGEQIQAAGIDPGLRAEKLSLADFAALARQL